MWVAVVQLRIVRMGMSQSLMAVPVRKRFANRSIVAMPMMCVVDMDILMLQRLVQVVMLMVLSEVQPQSDRHQDAGYPQLQGGRLAKDDEGQQCADERRQREVGAGTSGARMAQAEHEHHMAYADAEEPHHASSGDKFN